MTEFWGGPFSDELFEGYGQRWGAFQTSRFLRPKSWICQVGDVLLSLVKPPDMRNLHELTGKIRLHMRGCHQPNLMVCSTSHTTIYNMDLNVHLNWWYPGILMFGHHGDSSVSNSIWDSGVAESIHLINKIQYINIHKYTDIINMYIL